MYTHAVNLNEQCLAHLCRARHTLIDDRGVFFLYFFFFLFFFLSRALQNEPSLPRVVSGPGGRIAALRAGSRTLDHSVDAHEHGEFNHVRRHPGQETNR